MNVNTDIHVHGENVLKCECKFTLSVLLLLLFYWASVANAPNVLQPYWLILLSSDVPDLTASLLL